MAIRPVLRMGDARLLQPALPVADFSGLAEILKDMRDTMKALNGAGLAAPQIGIGLRVVIFGVPEMENPRYPDAEGVPETVLVNPVIAPKEPEMVEGWEGCLSVPGMRGLVPRYRFIRYQGYDENGNAIDRIASDFHARVVQHECDHLDGILYPMRVQDMRNFGYTDVLFPDMQVEDD
jgi:peptide deformylase